MLAAAEDNTEGDTSRTAFNAGGWFPVCSASVLDTMATKSPAAEFWRDIPPIPNSFKPDTLPEVHIANAPTEDERCGADVGVFSAAVAHALGTYAERMAKPDAGAVVD